MPKDGRKGRDSEGQFDDKVGEVPCPLITLLGVALHLSDHCVGTYKTVQLLAEKTPPASPPVQLDLSLSCLTKLQTGWMG